MKPGDRVRVTADGAEPGCEGFVTYDVPSNGDDVTVFLTSGAFIGMHYSYTYDTLEVIGKQKSDLHEVLDTVLPFV